MTERKDDGLNKPEHDDFERTVNLKSPLISSDEFDATLQLDNLEELLAEEETSSAEAPGPEDRRDNAPDTDAAAPEDAYDLGIQSGELHELDAFKVDAGNPESVTTAMEAPVDSPADEVSPPASEMNTPSDPPKRVELTEEHYAATAAPETNVSGSDPSSSVQTSGDSEDDAPADQPGEEVQTAASASSDGAPPTSPDETRDTEEPADAPTPAAEPLETATEDAGSPPTTESSRDESQPPRGAMPALLLGLLALGAAGASLWMNMQASDRLERLEQRLAAVENRAARPAGQPATAQLKTLTDQLRRLEERLEKHLKTVAETTPPKPQATSASPTVKAKNGATTSHKPAITPATPRVAASTANGGAWVVNLTSLSDPRAARAEVARLKRMGIAAQRIEVRAGGRTWQRIRVPGFASRAAAEQARKSLEQQLHIRDAWVSRR